MRTRASPSSSGRTEPGSISSSMARPPMMLITMRATSSAGIGMAGAPRWRPRLEPGGEGAAKFGLALGVGGAELGVADREAPVLALDQHGLAVLVQLTSKLAGCL